MAKADTMAFEVWISRGGAEVLLVGEASSDSRPPRDAGGDEMLYAAGFCERSWNEAIEVVYVLTGRALIFTPAER